MPDLPLYPTVISVSLAVAAAAHRFGGVPFPVALVLVAAGVLVAGFAAYQAPEPAAPANLVQKMSRRVIARAIRWAVGTAILSVGTVVALLAVR